MVALVVLLCGTLKVMESYHATLRADREARENYQAALLLESHVLEMEKTGRVDGVAEVDPTLGAVTWEQSANAAALPGWKDQRLVLKWGAERRRSQLELSAIVPN